MPNRTKKSQKAQAKRARPQRARKNKRTISAGLSQQYGGVPFNNVHTYMDNSSNSLHNRMSGAGEVGMSGGDGGILGIKGSSGNFYLDSLVDPSRPPVRIPDLYSKRTAVHKTFLYGTLTPAEVTAGSGNFQWSVCLNPVLGGTSSTIGSTSVTTCVGNGAGSYTATRQIDVDYGTMDDIVNEIRPVSAYLYCTFVGDTLSDGGQVAAAFMPSGSMDITEALPVSNDATGNQDLANYANLSTQPGAYLGPNRKGCFIRWAPEDERDSFFYTLAAAQNFDFPKLIASGVTTQSQASIRWVVEINFELTTQSRLLTQIPSPIRLKLIEHAKIALQTMPYACANDDHDSIWSRFLNWAKGAWHSVTNFYNDDIKPVLSPVLSGVGAVADAIGLPEIGVPLGAAGRFIGSH